MDRTQKAVLELIHQSYPDPINKSRIMSLLYLVDVGWKYSSLTRYRYQKFSNGVYTGELQTDLVKLLEMDLIREVHTTGRGTHYTIDYYSKSRNDEYVLTPDLQVQVQNVYQATENIETRDLDQLVYSHPKVKDSKKYEELPTTITHFI